MKVDLKKFNIVSLIFLLIFLLAGFLRFYNLGYSNYQGDEIKAFYNPTGNQNFYEFIFDQRKGPLQFLVTLAIKPFSDNYFNHFVMRLPFALAGFVSIILFYLVVKNFYNQKIALYATIFFATSGFLVAFSRIVQYQSFVILFGLVSIFLGQKFIESKKYLFVYLSIFSLALSLLFHYDGVFFGVALAFLYLKELYFERKNKKIWINFIVSGILLISILASFYVPLVLNLDNASLEYFRERIEGVGGDNKISSSLFNFNLYQPYFSLYAYIIFGILGLFSFIKNYKNYTSLTIILWFMVAFIFMETLIQSPGTHIYTYLIPLMIILGVGVDFCIKVFKNKILNYLSISIFIILTTHLFLQSYVLFVENSTEYPWQEKKIYYFDLKRLTQADNRNYYLSIFGFPYNRNWMEIREFLKDYNGEYDSSEKNSIASFYLQNMRFKNNSKTYVEIEFPQSFSRANRRDYTPLKTIENPNGTKSLIYFLN